MSTFALPKCLCCGVTYSYRWRNSVDGPKTLCKSCGDEYRRFNMRLYKDPKTQKVSIRHSTGAIPVRVVAFKLKNPNIPNRVSWFDPIVTRESEFLYPECSVAQKVELNRGTGMAKEVRGENRGGKIRRGRPNVNMSRSNSSWCSSSFVPITRPVKKGKNIEIVEEDNYSGESYGIKRKMGFREERVPKKVVKTKGFERNALSGIGRSGYGSIRKAVIPNTAEESEDSSVVFVRENIQVDGSAVKGKRTNCRDGQAYLEDDEVQCVGGFESKVGKLKLPSVGARELCGASSCKNEQKVLPDESQKQNSSVERRRNQMRREKHFESFILKVKYGQELQRFMFREEVSFQSIIACVEVAFKIQGDIRLKYVDDEGDMITLGSDEGVAALREMIGSQQLDKIRLEVFGGH